MLRKRKLEHNIRVYHMILFWGWSLLFYLMSHDIDLYRLLDAQNVLDLFVFQKHGQTDCSSSSVYCTTRYVERHLFYFSWFKSWFFYVCKGPRTLRTKLHKICCFSNSTHASTFCHNCNDFFDSFTVFIGQQFPQFNFILKISSSY